MTIAEPKQFETYVAKGRRLGAYTFDFLIADEIGRSWYDGSVEQALPERVWCMEHIREGMTVLDCGAHHGLMTILFSLRTGPKGRVLAWDALPENAEVVRENAALNGLENVAVYAHALGERTETVRYDHNFGNINVVSGSDARLSTIMVVPLDAEIEPGLHVDFLKLDVEGSELPALRGASGVLAQRPIIDLELHNFLFQDKLKELGDIAAILAPLDYRYEVLGDVTGNVVPVGAVLDTAWLAQFYNPHVFCIPG